MSVGFYRITQIIDAEKSVIAESQCASGIKGVFYLPPLNRASASGISVGDTFFGVLDEASGLGALLVMTDGHDFGRFFDYAVQIKSDLTITGSASVSGEISSNIKLKSPVISTTAARGAMTLTPEDCAAIVGAATSGAPVEITPTAITLLSE